jgi:hypothetical protein
VKPRNDSPLGVGFHHAFDDSARRIGRPVLKDRHGSILDFRFWIFDSSDPENLKSLSEAGFRWTRRLTRPDPKSKIENPKFP